MQCRKFRKGKKSAKKMRRRKLQKKCNSENATLEIAFFRILRCICFGAVAFLFAFFRFFFVKKIQKLIKVAKNATEKMQRRKLQKKCNGENATLEVAFFFAFSVPDELFMYVSYFCFSPPICLSLHPTAQPFIATLPITPTSFNPLRFPCMLTPLHPFVP